MNVTSLELSKQLYEVSGLESGEPYRYDNGLKKHVRDIEVFNSSVCPVYTLGFLIRQLPIGVSIDKATDGYGARRPPVYGVPEDAPFEGQIRFPADTPEDATAALLIELYRAGILTPNPKGTSNE